MQRIIFIIFALFCLNSFAQNKQETSNQPHQVISAQEFNAKLKTDNGILLDVRTPAEYKKGHIAGATLLDIFSETFEADLNKLDKTKTYFVYCAAGGRSDEACELMQKKGFKLMYDLDGGFTKWKQVGLPIEQ